MRSFQLTAAAIVAMAAGQVVSAQVLEDFEHGNPGLYTGSAGGTFEITAAAAKEGALGAHFGTSSSFFYRTDIQTAAGNAYQAWVRMVGSTRLYMGVDADAGGAISAVLAPNTSTIILQDNTGWGFADLASAPFVPALGVWYLLEIDWAADGTMIVRIYDEFGTPLAETSPVGTGRTGEGGLSWRSFSAGADADSFGFSGPPTENALVLDWNSVSHVGATATAAAGLFPLVTTTPVDFVDALGMGPWQMVTIDNPSNGFDTATSNAIANYIAKDGRVHMSYWNLDADPTLQAAFGVSSTVDFFDPRPVFERGDHPSWGGISSVPVGAGPSPWIDNGDELSVAGGDCSGGAPQVLGDFDSAGSGIGAIVTSGARTLVNGFDYDSMDLASVEMLVTSQIRWLRNAEAGPSIGPSGCIADCDKNMAVDFFDFLCFQNQFAAGDCAANCDFNDQLDFFDFLCFQNEFAAGCPDLELKQYGTEAPPSVDCGVSITQFPLDPRGVFTDVTTVPSPLGGDVTFDTACNVRQIGLGWATWSHGYVGSVYYTNGSAVLNIAPPANSAFHVYAEPNPFADIEFEITGSAGGTELSVTEFIHGSAGAKGYGFCGGVENVRVRTTDGITDFAVGEFGIAN